jgi:hypothetical protein
MSTQFREINRTVSAGDVVISVAEIFDRLQTKVDPNTLEQLLRDILAGRRNQVRPGELITAELINQILAELESLQGRVTKLESGSIGTTPTLAITEIKPAGPYTVTQQIQVIGRNFGFSIGAHRVSIDGVRVLTFKEGSDNQNLIFDMPNIPNIPPEGKTVVLSVSNQTSTETRTVVVLRLQIALGGNVDVSFESVEPATPVAGGPAMFRYKVKSRANQPAQFLVTPTITVASNQQEWNDALQVLDDSGNQIVSSMIAVAPQEEKFFRIRLSTVPASPPNATFTLAVSAGATGVTATPDSRPFTVGQATEQQDSTLTLNFFSANPSSAFSAGAVRLAQGGAGRITLIAEFHVAGTYPITPAILSGTGWTAERSSSTPENMIIASSDLENPQATATRNLDFIMRAAAGAAATGQVEYRVQRQGQTNRRTLRLNLALQ